MNKSPRSKEKMTRTCSTFMAKREKDLALQKILVKNRSKNIYYFLINYKFYFSNLNNKVKLICLH